MGWRGLGRGGRGFWLLGTRRRQAPGFAQSRVSSPVVRMIRPSLATLASAGRAVSVPCPFVDAFEDQRAADLFGSFADEEGPEKQEGGQPEDHGQDHGDIRDKELWRRWLGGVLDRFEFFGVDLCQEQTIPQHGVVSFPATGPASSSPSVWMFS